MINMKLKAFITGIREKMQSDSQNSYRRVGLAIALLKRQNLLYKNKACFVELGPVVDICSRGLIVRYVETRNRMQFVEHLAISVPFKGIVVDIPICGDKSPDNRNNLSEYEQTPQTRWRIFMDRASTRNKMKFIALPGPLHHGWAKDFEKKE